MQSLKSFSSFPNEIDKNEQIQIFYWLIINSVYRASHWQQHQVLWRVEAPLVYPRG